jgi:hypothetical protein
MLHPVLLCYGASPLMTGKSLAIKSNYISGIALKGQNIIVQGESPVIKVVNRGVLAGFLQKNVYKDNERCVF